MKDDKHNSRKSTRLTAKGNPGGDRQNDGTVPPKHPARKKSRKSSRRKRRRFRSAGGPGGDSQGGGTIPPGIVALGGTGGDSQGEGTIPPKMSIRQRERLARFRGARKVPGSVYVNRDEIVEILNRKLGGLWLKGYQQVAFIGDTDYYCPPFDEIAGMLKQRGRQRHYYPEIFDCDDFSYELKGQFVRHAFANGRRRPFGFAIGLVWLGKPFPHAMNWVISWTHGRRDERTLYLVEPQTDKLYDIDEKTGQLREVSWWTGRIGKKAGKPHRDIYFTMI